MNLLNQSIEAGGHRWKVLFFPTGGESHGRGWIAVVMVRRTPGGKIQPWRRTFVERILRKTVPSEMVKGKGRTPEEAIDWLRQELRKETA
jgi:hypothetical protein